MSSLQIGFASAEFTLAALCIGIFLVFWYRDGKKRILLGTLGALIPIFLGLDIVFSWIPL